MHSVSESQSEMSGKRSERAENWYVTEQDCGSGVQSGSGSAGAECRAVAGVRERSAGLRERSAER